MVSPESRALVLVDGHCLLCQAWVKFLVPRDRHRRMAFAPLQSGYAAAALREAGVDSETITLARRSTGGGSPSETSWEGRIGSTEQIGGEGRTGASARTGPGDGPGSVLLLRAGRLHDRSDAAIRILALLGFPWSLARVCLLVPGPIRNAVYDFVARRRYRWFGRSETCMVPPVDLDQCVRGHDEAGRSGLGA
ncbi:MAG: DCC1-like thiol-disulfide oxidoreductase family protein [Candidatus Eisenbacteria bacterium]